MDKAKSLGTQIEQDYRNNFQGPFPLEDTLKLKSFDQTNWMSLHTSLDMFFAYVAGYASSASRLGRRPHTELADARKNLTKSFFERHDSLAHYGNAINEKSTPDLFRRLATVENLRKKLLLLMGQILQDGKES